MSYCILCGNEMVDGACPNNHDFKSMCLNCTSCSNEGDNFICENSENMSETLEKIKTAAKEAAGGYEMETCNIELKPLRLKKPTAKCKRWILDEKKVIEAFMANLNGK